MSDDEAIRGVGDVRSTVEPDAFPPVEASERKSRKAIDAADKNPNVLAMWNKFFAICDCVPLKTLAEAEEMFAGCEPL